MRRLLARSFGAATFTEVQQSCACIAQRQSWNLELGLWKGAAWAGGGTYGIAWRSVSRLSCSSSGSGGSGGDGGSTGSTGRSSTAETGALPAGPRGSSAIRQGSQTRSGGNASPASRSSLPKASTGPSKAQPGRVQGQAAGLARRELGQAMQVLNQSLGRIRVLLKNQAAPAALQRMPTQVVLKSLAPFIRDMRTRRLQEDRELVQYFLHLSSADMLGGDAPPATPEASLTPLSSSSASTSEPTPSPSMGDTDAPCTGSTAAGLPKAAMPAPTPAPTDASPPTTAPTPLTEKLKTLDLTVSRFLYEYLMIHCVDEMHESQQLQNLTQPHQWFPFARSIHRRIVYHAGPTNSGKTHNAVLALKAAQTGVYCSPLRLLALEQYDRLNQEGVLCNLVTGEEVKEVPEATHVSCTVEMANLNRRWDVAVVDEIQMIGDNARGSAWTRALLGLPASEVHLCGDATALELVRRLCKDTGEELVVHTYERPSVLRAEKTVLGDISRVQDGDCIVTFSKRRIFMYKKAIETNTKHKVCVVYGTLPAETRRSQAQLFNSPDSGYNVLVATDAVGMGLNLNIRRVVFDTVWRPSGKLDLHGKPVMELLSDSAIKQIAGRAGRRNSDYPEGLVTAVHLEDLVRVKAALANTLEPLMRSRLYPEPDQIERLASTMQDAPFEEVLTKFQESEVVLGSNHALCNADSLASLAKLIAPITNLSVADRLRICMAPVNQSKPELCALLYALASKYAAGVPVPPPRLIEPGSPRAKLLQLLRDGVLCTMAGLPPVSTLDAFLTMQELEACHQMLTLWLWLSFRLDDKGQFAGRSVVQAQVAEVQYGLSRLLELITGTKLHYGSVKVNKGKAAGKSKAKTVKSSAAAGSRAVEGAGGGAKVVAVAAAG